MTLNHNYGCSNEAVAGIAGNVEHNSSLGLINPELSKLKIKITSTKQIINQA